MKEVQFPVCSNSGETFESCCHFDCDKKYVDQSIKANRIGRCDELVSPFYADSSIKNKVEKYGVCDHDVLRDYEIL